MVKGKGRWKSEEKRETNGERREKRTGVEKVL